MFNEKAKTADAVGAALEKALGSTAKASAGGVYRIECLDKDGFTGTAYTAVWYLGLYGAGASNTPSGSDTMALHPGWTEIAPYSNATRPAATFGAASLADPSIITNSGSPAQFNINASSVVGGAFLVNNNTKLGSTGILFSASDFQSPGDRTVASGDTLNVTYTFSLDAA